MRTRWSERTFPDPGSINRPAWISTVSAVADEAARIAAARSAVSLAMIPSPSIHLGRSYVSSARAPVFPRLRAFVEHLVDEAESLGLVRLEELVAVHRLLDLGER